MKKEYLKSFGLIILGGILTLTASSLIEKSYASELKNKRNSWENPENRYSGSFNLPTEEEEVECEQSDDPAKICYKDAQRDIAAYQMWLKYLPKYVSLDTNENLITYYGQSISKDDLNTLKTYLDTFLDNNKSFSYYHFPFHTKLAQSYYIDKSKIDTAFSADTSATGINVHIGVRGLKGLKLNSMESHLYVVPTRKIIHDNDTTLQDSLIAGKYALDLTHPCPALCDTKGVLYQPKLSPNPED